MRRSGRGPRGTGCSQALPRTRRPTTAARPAPHGPRRAGYRRAPATGRAAPAYDDPVTLPRLHVEKDPFCPACGDIIAAAVYTGWPGNLVLAAPDGHRIQPESAAVQILQAQQDQTSSAPAARLAAPDHLDFLA